jgi:hypothetical protein
MTPSIKIVLLGFAGTGKSLALYNARKHLQCNGDAQTSMNCKIHKFTIQSTRVSVWSVAYTVDTAEANLILRDVDGAIIFSTTHTKPFQENVLKYSPGAFINIINVGALPDIDALSIHLKNRLESLVATIVGPPAAEVKLEPAPVPHAGREVWLLSGDPEDDDCEMHMTKEELHKEIYGQYGFLASHGSAKYYGFTDDDGEHCVYPTLDRFAQAVIDKNMVTVKRATLYESNPIVS